MNLILNFVDWLGSMILIACVILAMFPAGILFPQIGGREVLHVHERQRNGQGQKGGMEKGQTVDWLFSWLFSWTDDGVDSLGELGLILPLTFGQSVGQSYGMCCMLFSQCVSVIMRSCEAKKAFWRVYKVFTFNLPRVFSSIFVESHINSNKDYIIPPTSYIYICIFIYT